MKLKIRIINYPYQNISNIDIYLVKGVDVVYVEGIAAKLHSVSPTIIDEDIVKYPLLYIYQLIETCISYASETSDNNVKESTKLFIKLYEKYFDEIETNTLADYQYSINNRIRELKEKAKEVEILPCITDIYNIEFNAKIMKLEQERRKELNMLKQIKKGTSLYKEYKYKIEVLDRQINQIRKQLND